MDMILPAIPITLPSHLHTHTTHTYAPTTSNTWCFCTRTNSRKPWTHGWQHNHNTYSLPTTKKGPLFPQKTLQAPQQGLHSPSMRQAEVTSSLFWNWNFHLSGSRPYPPTPLTLELKEVKAKLKQLSDHQPTEGLCGGYTWMQIVSV